MQNQISLLCSGSTHLPFRLHTAITQYGEGRLCLQQYGMVFFFRYCFFLSPFFFSFSLSRLDKFKLKFSKSHYQPCRGINSNITKAIIFFITGYFFLTLTVFCQETKRFFFLVFFSWGGGGGGGGVKGHYSVTYKFH